MQQIRSKGSCNLVFQRIDNAGKMLSSGRSSANVLRILNICDISAQSPFSARAPELATTGAAYVFACLIQNRVEWGPIGGT
jgi:hypothetical protein